MESGLTWSPEVSASSPTLPSSTSPSLPTQAATPSAPTAAPRRAERRAQAEARREREAARTGRRAALKGAGARLLPRGAVLAALATATVVVPLTGTSDGDASATVASRAVAVGLPTAYDVLSEGVAGASTPTSLLAAAPGAVRSSEAVSRSIERDPLPGCDGQAREASSNGQIPAADLCALWDPDQMLRGDAAVALSELNDNFRAAFGRDLCLTDSYRSLAEQRRVAYTKPGLAATPGTSNHGWGLAIDLCTTETNQSATMRWLGENGPTYGWDNPQWARRGGSGAYEPWHWEFVPGTTALGTNY